MARGAWRSFGQRIAAPHSEFQGRRPGSATPIRSPAEIWLEIQDAPEAPIDLAQQGQRHNRCLIAQVRLVEGHHGGHIDDGVSR